MPLVPMIGAIDGSNLLYSLPWAYAPGTVAVFLNGALLSRNDGSHPWIETNPGLGLVTLVGVDYTPRVGDSLFAFASRFGESLAQELVVGEIYAMLQSDHRLAAFIAPEQVIASIASEAYLRAVMSDDDESAVIAGENNIKSQPDCETN